MEKITGGLCTKENREKLEQSRLILEKICNYKLKLREAKHKNSVVNIYDMANAIIGEDIEFNNALSQESKANQLKELADIINCCHAVAMMIIF